MADEYVRAHNEVRAALEEPPNYPGTWEPLPPVTWSDEVADGAREWAQHLADTNDCDLEHSSGTGYGENLAGSSGSLSPATAVALWASEEEDYTFDPVYRFDADTGHYTQIVWRESIAIGCGSARCGSATVICCRYSPPGNFIGNQPY
jgi:pathogenesis-related protein 1